jgi:hypothetical protein
MSAGALARSDMHYTRAGHAANGAAVLGHGGGYGDDSMMERSANSARIVKTTVAKATMVFQLTSMS